MHEQFFIPVRVSDLKIMIHKNSIKGAGFFTDAAIHADSKINIENRGPLKGFSVLIKFADDINAFWRTFFGANVASNTAEIIRLIVINKKGEIAEAFFLREPLFGKLAGENRAVFSGFSEIGEEKMLQRDQHALDDSCTENH